MNTTHVTGDGENGSTRQPLKHLAPLRAIPGLVTLRGVDVNDAVHNVPDSADEVAPLVLCKRPV